MHISPNIYFFGMLLFLFIDWCLRNAHDIDWHVPNQCETSDACIFTNTAPLELRLRLRRVLIVSVSEIAMATPAPLK